MRRSWAHVDRYECPLCAGTVVVQNTGADGYYANHHGGECVATTKYSVDARTTVATPTDWAAGR